MTEQLLSKNYSAVLRKVFIIQQISGIKVAQLFYYLFQNEFSSTLEKSSLKIMSYCRRQVLFQKCILKLFFLGKSLKIVHIKTRLTNLIGMVSIIKQRRGLEKRQVCTITLKRYPSKKSRLVWNSVMKTANNCHHAALPIIQIRQSNNKT